MSERDEKLNLIIGRLDVMINLMFKSMEKDGKEISAKDKIVMLDSFGLRPVDISKIVGKSRNYVDVQLSLARKSKKPRPGEE
jgi:hypothetical protein